MSREKTLIKNTFIYAIGNLLSKCVGFILLPFYTAYFKPEDYGYFDLITTTMALLIPIVTFQLTDGIYRYLIEADSYKEKQKIISSSFNIIFIGMLISNIVYFIFVHFIRLQFRYEILIMADLSVLYGIWSQIARGLKKNVEYSFSGVIVTIVTISMNIFLVLYTNLRVEAMIISNIVASIVVLLYLEYKLKIIKYITFAVKDIELQKRLIVYSVPLLANVINWWVMNVSDRYIINYFLGMEANGIYAIANKFPTMLMMFSGIFTLAWQESAITENNSKDRDNFYSNMFNSFMKFEVTICLILISFTKVVTAIMVNSKYQVSWKYVPFLYLGAVFNSFAAFYGVGYQVAKETKGSFYTSMVGAVINILINIAMIPYIGIQAASLSTMIGFLVMWLLRIYQTKKYFDIKINKINIFKLSILLIVFTSLYFYNNKIIDVILMLSSILIFFIFNKELIYKVILKIKKK